MLLRLLRSGWAALAKLQAIAIGRSVIAFTDFKTWRTRLTVPTLELSQFDAVGLFHRTDKIVTGHGLTIMALEVQVAAFAKTFGTDQGANHAHHFRAFLIHRQGVKVGNFHKGIGAHRMGHGTCIFGELVGAQVGHILNPLDRARMHIGAELGVAEHGEAFFQR